MNKIFIVIPVHNKIEYTTKCLDSLKNQSHPDYEVIVVDDGSQDNSFEIISTHYPEVILLKGDGNLWWTGGTNLGVEYALSKADSADFILTLNNDLEVEPDYLSNLLKVYEITRPSLVGSVSVDIKNPEKIEFLGKKWNPYTAKSKPSIEGVESYSSLVQKHKFISSDVLPGRGTLIPVEVFKKIGLFDFKHFPQYTADHDFARRAYKHGYKLVVSTEAVVKSVVESTGLTYLHNPSFKVFIRSFFSIKSPINLKSIYYYSIRHSPIKLGYLLINILRLCGSFARAYVKRLRVN